MALYRIEVASEKCSGCLRCQLACSETHTKRFNPSAARIHVEMTGSDCTIDFAADCTHCGICAENCLYDVLQKHPLEKL